MKNRIKIRDIEEDMLGFLKECQRNKDDPEWQQKIIEWCRENNLMPNDTADERPTCQKGCLDKDTGQVRKMKWSKYIKP